MNAKSLKKKSQTDWDKVDDLSDKEIDTSDIPLLDKEFFKNAELHMPTRKKSITVRLDSDVLEWFREQGKGYQTKMNAILRTYMKAHNK
ncbi:MAG: BrnA antitoxin family protein [Gammaproteobacteria bacterium]|nr:MAG: BrnA antitoxin family protein [Gammaproteobacteria bacterium]